MIFSSTYARIGFVLLSAIVALVVSACNSPTGGSTPTVTPTPTATPIASAGTNTVPAKIVADIPKSLVKRNATTTAAHSRGLAQHSISRAGNNVATSGAYAQLQDTIKSMSDELINAAIYLIYVDEAIKGVTPSDTKISSKSVTVNQAMINSITAAIPDSVRDTSTASIPELGDVIYLDDFVYNTFTPTTNDPYNFKFEIAYTYTDDIYPDSQVIQTYSESLFWSTDKKSIKLKMTSTMNGSSTTTESFIITYDDSVKSSTMIYDTDTITSKVQIKEKTDAASQAKNGVYVFLDQAEKVAEDSVSGTTGGTYSYNAKGVADDLGGYLESSYKYPAATGFGVDVYKYKESFDGNGILKDAQYLEPGTTTWIQDPSYDAYNTNTPDTYAEEYASETTGINDAQEELETSDQYASTDLEAEGAYYFEISNTQTENLTEGKIYIAYDGVTDITDATQILSYVGFAYADGVGSLGISFDEIHKTGKVVYLYEFDLVNETFVSSNPLTLTL